MSTQTFLCRLFGGRDVGVIYDSGAGTITIAGQSLTLSTLSSALQSQFTSALASGGVVASANGPGRASFCGDNVQAAVGAIADAQATWRNAVISALASVTTP